MIIIGILLVNLRIVPGYTDVYGTISVYCIPFSISLYLLNVDLKQIMKMSKQPLLSIASAVFCVSVVAVIFGVIFGNRIEEERQQSKKRARKVECEEAYKAKREKIEVLQFEKPKKN